MGAPVPKVEAAENTSAEAFLSSFETIAARERRKHASVYNYWLSIRGDRPFPPIRDLDPLEIAESGPSSVLLEMVGGGEDAEIRHIGQAIKGGVEAERISDAPSPSLLSCIYAQLPIVAACRQPIAFEQEFASEGGKRRCWVTLLPFSANGTWIDYVYGFVSLNGNAADDDEGPAQEAEAADAAEDPFKVPLRPLDEDPEPVEAAVERGDETPEAVEEQPEAELVDSTAAEEVFEREPEDVPVVAIDELPEAEGVEEYVPDPVEQAAEAPEAADELPAELLDGWSEPVEEFDAEASADTATPRSTKPGFSAKLLESLASVSGFYGRVVQVEPGDQVPEEAPSADLPEPAGIVAEDSIAAPTHQAEGNLQIKLNEVRAKAEEARQAQIRSQAALIEGLSAAYDFALDAESAPEEYLRLVESQGLKIQLRSPMKPVVKLGFDGVCDEQTIADLEAVLAWALKQDLPRGSLAERIDAAGGIEPILNGQAN